VFQTDRSEGCVSASSKRQFSPAEGECVIAVVFLSHSAAALGLKHAGCLHLSHVRTAYPSVNVRRSARSRTAIGGGISSRRPRGDNLLIKMRNCCVYLAVSLRLRPSTGDRVWKWRGKVRGLGDTTPSRGPRVELRCGVRGKTPRS